MGQVSVLTTIIISAVVMLAMVALSITVMVKGPSTRQARITMASVCVVSLMLASITPLAWANAVRHGAYDVSMPVADVAHATANAPVPDPLPDDLDGKILLFYRYSCPDCEMLHNEIEAWRQSHDDVLWVSTRSAEGAPLVQEFVIGSVPSAVYVADRDAGKFVYAPLCVTVDGEEVLDRDALDGLVKQREADATR